MALLGEGDVLLRLTFGHSSPDAALAALAKQLGLSSIFSLDATIADFRTESATWIGELAQRLQAYADGSRDDFRNVRLDLSGLSDFQRKVVERCRRIPFGQTMTYGQLAEQAGSPDAARAVGNVMAANPTPLVVPCHRVVAAGGKIGHYSAGEGRRTKLRLLETEGAEGVR